MGKVRISKRAVVIVVHSRGQYAAIMHAERDGIELPAGGVEPNETWIDAVERELFEETGLHAKYITRICSLPSTVECVAFLATATGRMKSSTEGYAFWSTTSELIGPNATFRENNRLVLEALRRLP